MSDLRATFSPELRRHLLDMAQDGKGADDLLRSLSKQLPASEWTDFFRGELKRIRKLLKAGDSQASLEVIGGLAEWSLNSGAFELACALCGLGSTSITGRSRSSYIARANNYNCIGLIAFRLGETDRARSLFERSISASERAGDLGWQAAAWLNIANVERVDDRPSDARTAAQKSLDLYVRIRDEEGQVDLLLTLGDIAVETGAEEDAHSIYSRLQPMVRKLREPGATASMHGLRGRMLSEVGEFSAAEGAYRLALAASRRAMDADKEVTSLHNLAAVARDMGKTYVARARCSKAVEVATERGLVGRLGVLLPWLCRMAITDGDAQTAMSAAHRLAAITSQKTVLAQAESELLLGVADLMIENLDGGLAHLDAALEALGRSSDPGVDSLLADVLSNIMAAIQSDERLVSRAAELTQRIRGVPEPRGSELLQRLGIALALEASNHAELAGHLLMESLMRRPPRQRAWTAQLVSAQLESYRHAGIAIPLLRQGRRDASRAGQSSNLRSVTNDLGIALAYAGDYQRAARLLEANLNDADSCGDSLTALLARQNLAEVYRELGNSRAAEQRTIEWLAAAMESGERAREAEARLQLALILLDQERWDEANSQLRELQQFDRLGSDTEASIYSGLATIAYVRNDYSSAQENWRKACNVPGQSVHHRAEHLLMLSELHARLGERRSFNRTMQRAVDAVVEVGIDQDLGALLTRSALRWLEQSKFKFAGELVGIAAVLGVAEASKQANTDFAASNGPYIAGVGSAFAMLSLADEQGAPRDVVQRACEKTLREHLPDSLTEVLIDHLLNQSDSPGS